MEASLIRWIDFKILKLENDRKQIEDQMKAYVTAIADLDYEIAVLKEAKLEGSFSV